MTWKGWAINIVWWPGQMWRAINLMAEYIWRPRPRMNWIGCLGGSFDQILVVRSEDEPRVVAKVPSRWANQRGRGDRSRASAHERRIGRLRSRREHRGNHR